MLSICGSRVIKADRPSGSDMARKRLFSVCKACILKARSTLTLSTSGSNGLARKSYAPMPTACRALAWSFWPVSTITLVSGSAANIISSSLNPSDTASASGGNPRSIVTTAGEWRRSCVTDSNRSSDHLICFCSAGSSSTINRGCIFSVVMHSPLCANPMRGKFPPREDANAPLFLFQLHFPLKSYLQVLAHTENFHSCQCPYRPPWSFEKA